jgi:hypothetical protein
MTYFSLKFVTSIVVDVPRPICSVRTECIPFRYFATSQGALWDKVAASKCSVEPTG